MMDFGAEKRRCEGARLRVIMKMPEQLRRAGPASRAEQMHLQSVGVDDVRACGGEMPPQTGRVAEGGKRRPAHCSAEADAGDRRITSAPLAQTSQRLRKFQSDRPNSQFARARQQRAVG